VPQRTSAADFLEGSKSPGQDIRAVRHIAAGLRTFVVEVPSDANSLEADADTDPAERGSWNEHRGVRAGHLLFVSGAPAVLAVIDRRSGRALTEKLASYGMGAVASSWLIAGMVA
jgi:hypothetical protein